MNYEDWILFQWCLNHWEELYTESQLSDLYYEEYKAERYINEMKADGLL